MKKYTFSVIFLIFLGISFVGAREIFSQQLTLSISPPILEVIIKPGKEVSQPFILTSLGANTLINTKVVPFAPADEIGNVHLIENSTEVDLYSSWFSLSKPKVAFNEPFSLAQGTVQDIILNISPPLDAREGDYYFTLLFESDPRGRLGVNQSSAKTRIGANILLTVSETGLPRKTAKVVQFSAPKIIDSLSPLAYTVRIENTSNSFFKPMGKISVDPLLGNTQALSLAPQNILSSSIRNVSCIEDQVLIDCKLKNKVLLGTYRATLSFSLDEEGSEITETTTTFAFPFSILIALSGIWTVYKVMKRKLSR